MCESGSESPEGLFLLESEGFRRSLEGNEDGCDCYFLRSFCFRGIGNNSDPSVFGISLVDNIPIDRTIGRSPELQKDSKF